MKRSKFSEEQITHALCSYEAGTRLEDICRQLGIKQATFYVLKKKYAHVGVGVERAASATRRECAAQAPGLGI